MLCQNYKLGTANSAWGILDNMEETLKMLEFAL